MRKARNMGLMVVVTAHYAADPDAVFQSALRFSEMADAMRGIATYSGLPASDTAREGERITVDVTFWGLFTQRGHVMFIERLDPQARIIQRRESGNGISRWDHTLSVQPDGSRACWTDTVIIEAGWRTWFIARFAAFIYTRRHRHRKATSLTCRISTVSG
ncbi:MAG: hypothetical protein IPK89_11955 [Sphingomonadales bacterium]|nr:hypothetical protein [Sphingomonadales bacterium]